MKDQLKILYAVLIYSLIVNAIGTAGMYLGNRSLAFLIYITCQILTGGVPLWALAVYYHRKEWAFWIFFFTRLLGILGTVTLIYDNWGNIVISNTTLLHFISGLILVSYLPIIYFIYKWSKSETE